MVVAALVGLGGLLLAREREVALTTEQLGLLIFIAAVAYAFLLIGRHFDRREHRTRE
jgi:hypothetical protein